MLYPVMSEKREVFSLDGIWNFKLDGLDLNENIKDNKLKDPMTMAVPSSYNDLKEGIEFRDFNGWVWYERDLYVTKKMLDERLIIRFGSATHSAKLYVNGKIVLEHKGGFLPFEAQINDLVKTGKNDIKIAVNNIVDFTTLPVGFTQEVEINGVKKLKVTPQFDFFNYAGIQRPVKIYTTPETYIEDIDIITDFKGSEGYIDYDINVVNPKGEVQIELIDEDQKVVATQTGTKNRIVINNVKLWQPLDAYLYDMNIKIFDEGVLVDEYILPVGVRTVRVDGSKFLINEKPFYFKGFGKHEDSHIHGRGFDEALNVKDIGLLKWIGANSYRTAHYPYSEEMMRLSAREGIVIIDETPAVGLLKGMMAFFGGGATDTDEKTTWEVMETFEHHKDVLRDLVKRDKNNPAVCMWSVANEADTWTKGTEDYFKPLIDLTREIDPQKRPITVVLVMMSFPENCLVSQFLDVISLNRYYGWYREGGALDEAEHNLRDELNRWKEKHPNTPVLFTEYGADTVAGMHDTTPVMFTEEYQAEYYAMNHKVFDEFDFVVGEQAWNFADFATTQGFLRVQGNKKGAFTRDRKPKMAAHAFKARWESIPEFDYKK
ncbi:MAG: beta-glucuronidase [Mycoplasmatales bacterium]